MKENIEYFHHVSMSFEPVLGSERDFAVLERMDISKVNKKIRKKGLTGIFSHKPNDDVDGYKYIYNSIGERAEDIAHVFAKLFPRMTFVAFVRYSHDDIDSCSAFDFVFDRWYIHAIDIGEYDYIKVIDPNQNHVIWQGYISADTDLQF